MRQLGFALQTYHDALGSLPPAGNTDQSEDWDLYTSGHAILLPFLEEANLLGIYNLQYPWEGQAPELISKVIPIYACPSSDADNPFFDPLATFFIETYDGSTAGDSGFGRTDYVFCKGITDAWCITPAQVPATERGLFDLNWAVKLRRVTDGTSRTIAMGEGAGGLRWPLSLPQTDPASRATPYGADSKGNIRLARQSWAAAEPIEDFALAVAPDLVVSALAACTLEPLNKSPVTPGVCSVAQKTNCNKSLPAAVGIVGVNASGGPHLAPNFRSDHPGGALFLFGDGSVHFVREDIDLRLYQMLSTMAGSEIASLAE